MPGLVAARAVAAGEVLFCWTGVLIGRNTGDRCLQVGQRHYLTPGPEEGEPPWVFLNHSFAPSVHVSHPPLPSKDPLPPVLTATANAALPVDAELTIDYTLHEYIMFGNGFVCAESGRAVRVLGTPATRIAVRYMLPVAHSFSVSCPAAASSAASTIGLSTMPVF